MSGLRITLTILVLVLVIGVVLVVPALADGPTFQTATGTRRGCWAGRTPRLRAAGDGSGSLVSLAESDGIHICWADLSWR